MSPVRAGTARPPVISADALAHQAEALTDALEVGADYLRPDLVREARRVTDKVGERMTMAGNHTVVALAGATGSGKSSLFNALVGEAVSPIGARRPTTAAPAAAVWGADSASELLDWLGVQTRHHVADPGPEIFGTLDSLVLLDLPDFDSRVVEHRHEVTRLLDLVDVFVWVTDPQKYADAVLHDEFVTVRAAHQPVTIAVLNQSDALGADALRACADDLRTLLVRDGLAEPQILVTSAKTGFGVPQLRQRLSNHVASASASRERLCADITTVARSLRRDVGEAEATIGESPDDALLAALARSAGVPVVLDAVEKDFRREAQGRTGWIFTRWSRAFSPEPLRRLRLDKVETRDGIPIGEADVRAVIGRSSLPPATPAARASLDLATVELGDSAARGLPNQWAHAVYAASSPSRHGLADALDRAVLSTPLRARAPLWWQVMGVLQVVFGAATLIGIGWLVVLFGAAGLQLPLPDPPSVGRLPVPTLMLVGGLLGGLLSAYLSRIMARVGGRRRRRLIEDRLVEAISAVADERLLTPVREVLKQHARTRTLLDQAASPTRT